MRDAGCLPYVTGKSPLIGQLKTQFFYRESKTGGEMLKFSKSYANAAEGNLKWKLFKNSNSVTTANNCEKF